MAPQNDDFEDFSAPPAHPCTVPLGVSFFRLSKVTGYGPGQNGRKQPIVDACSLPTADGTTRIEWDVSALTGANILENFGPGEYRATWISETERGKKASGTSNVFKIVDPNARTVAAPLPPATAPVFVAPPPPPPPPPAPVVVAPPPGPLDMFFQMQEVAERREQRSTQQADARADKAIERDRQFMTTVLGVFQPAARANSQLESVLQNVAQSVQALAQGQQQLAQLIAQQKAEFDARLAEFEADEGEEEEEEGEDDDDDATISETAAREGRQLIKTGIKEGLPLLLNHLSQISSPATPPATPPEPPPPPAPQALPLPSPAGAP